MSKQPDPTLKDRGPYGWRAGTARILANALLVLAAFGSVSLSALVAELTLKGTPPPLPPLQMGLLVALFALARWIFVLPGLLLVLVGIEVMARRAPRARFLTFLIALGPMILWELTNSPGAFPSPRGALLGVTAVLFALVARLPTRRGGPG